MTECETEKIARWMWRTKNGTILRMKDMSDSHLMNSIYLLERLGQDCYSQELIAMYSFESGLQGEMAQECMSQEIDNMEETDWMAMMPQIYFDLLIVAKGRRLLNEERIKNIEIYRKENRESETEWYKLSPKPVLITGVS